MLVNKSYLYFSIYISLCICGITNSYGQPTIPITTPVDYPSFQIQHTGQTEEGFIFLTTTSTSGIEYSIILDNLGNTIYYKEHLGKDLKVIQDTLLGYAESDKYYLMDTTYTIVDSIECAKDRNTDYHDIYFKQNGNPLLLCYDWIADVDLTYLDPSFTDQGVVKDYYIQELDIATKDLLYEWTTLGVLDYADNKHLTNYANFLINYIHMNSVSETMDGNILLSLRKFDEVTKVSTIDSSIIWRLGGNNSDFTFINDSLGFCSQHDAQELPNGNILLYDNANYTSNKPRVVEYELDMNAMTATLVKEFENNYILSADNQGNVQYLDNGNYFVCWGGVNLANPNVTEFNPAGQKVFELFIDSALTYSGMSYRAYRFMWGTNFPTLIEKSLDKDDILFLNYPNPFSSNTKITFYNHSYGNVTIDIRDMSGKRIKTILNQKKTFRDSQYKLRWEQFKSRDIYSYVEYERQHTHAKDYSRISRTPFLSS
ncbi:MAG: aryl-sulfate sulfotransferase [Flavobacteriales bacterium]|nr:aryl-sulfate sulfotransferase [Flavobacteriales bacterium]